MFACGWMPLHYRLGLLLHAVWLVPTTKDTFMKIVAVVRSVWTNRTPARYRVDKVSWGCRINTMIYKFVVPVA